MAKIKWNSKERAIAITAVKQWIADGQPVDVEAWATEYAVKYKGKSPAEMNENELRTALTKLLAEL